MPKPLVELETDVITTAIHNALPGNSIASSLSQAMNTTYYDYLPWEFACPLEHPIFRSK